MTEVRGNHINKIILSDPFPAIGVIIPAFRAEKHILKVLAGIPRFVSFIIVIDDCGPNHTVEIVRTCVDPRVSLVSHEKTRVLAAQ